MRDDPIVEEVRRARAQHAREHHNNLREIYDDLKKSQTESDKKVVSYPPKLRLRDVG
jgi:hypothetical protein